MKSDNNRIIFHSIRVFGFPRPGWNGNSNDADNNCIEQMNDFAEKEFRLPNYFVCGILYLNIIYKSGVAAAY